MKRFSERVLVAFLMVMSSFAFATNGGNDEWVSCTLGCKFFYLECKHFGERLDMQDSICEETMSACNRMCYATYYHEQ